MNYQVLASLALAANVLATSACDSFWLSQCQDPMTPGCAFTMKVTQTELRCGTDAQLDFQIANDNNEDLSAEEMMRAADIKVALRLPSGVLALPAPVFTEGHLRVVVPKTALTTEPSASGQLELSYAKTTLQTPLTYFCEQSFFHEAMAQRLSDTTLTSGPLKFGGLTKLSSGRSGLVFASIAAPTPTDIQYRAFKLSDSKKSLIPDSALPKSTVIDFNTIQQLRVAQKNPTSSVSGYVFYTGGPVTTDSSNTAYSNADQDLFMRPLLAATGASSLVATYSGGTLLMHDELAADYFPYPVKLTGIVRALAIGDLANPGKSQLLATLEGGGASLWDISLPSGANGTVVGSSSDASGLSAKLIQLDGPGGLIISAVALAEFNGDQLTDALVLRSLPPAGAHSELGIIYQGPNGTYQDWHPVSITEDPALSTTSILTQNIQSVDVGLLDGDQIPDLVIATKTEVRLYLGVAH